MRSLVNQRFFYFEVKRNFLVFLNSYYEKVKYVEKNLDVYKLMVRENFLILHYKFLY